MKLSFNEWFKTWHKSKEFKYWEKSQGTGLKRVHELMSQVNRYYKIYKHKKNSKSGNGQTEQQKNEKVTIRN